MARLYRAPEQAVSMGQVEAGVGVGRREEASGAKTYRNSIIDRARGKALDGYGFYKPLPMWLRKFHR
jgi:hypothetical protein